MQSMLSLLSLLSLKHQNCIQTSLSLTTSIHQAVIKSFFLSPLKCHLNHSFLHSHYISSSLTLYFGLHNSFVTIQLPQYPVYPHCTRDILIINTFELLIPLLKNSFWFPTAFNIKSKFFMRPHLVCPTSSYHKP